MVRRISEFIGKALSFRPTIGTFLLIVVLVIGTVSIARLIPSTLPGDMSKIARAFYVAELAYLRQGEAKPLSPDYSGGNILTAEGGDSVTDHITWDLYTNSAWLAQLYRDVVPYYAYENLVARGRTPELVAFLPLEDNESFHILGEYFGVMDAIALNERFLYDPRFSDERELLGTLIHEGIHAQGGNYLEGDSVWVESHTSAATLEVEAAMCNYNKEVACRAFWYDLHDLARSTFRSYARKYNAEGLFLFVNKMLWRTTGEWSWADKSSRHWADNQGELSEILYKYSQLPFENMVIPNICSLAAFDTGINQTDDEGVLRRILTVFDDTQYVLGVYRPLVCLGARYEPVQTIDMDLSGVPSK